MTGAAQLAATFDLASFARALATGDIAEVLVSYAPGAEVRVAGDGPPPVPPLVLTGRSVVAAWLVSSAWPGRDCDVFHLVDGGDRIAFSQRWEHGDGTTTLLTSTAELQDGLIMVQHTISDPRRRPSVRAAKGS